MYKVKAEALMKSRSRFACLEFRHSQLCPGPRPRRQWETGLTAHEVSGPLITLVLINVR